jgi:hypothetical protein
MNAAGTSLPGALSVLRQLARKREELEGCELCGDRIQAGHPHLVDPRKRELRCACDACALLFSEGQGTRWKRVPRRAELLDGFRLTDAHWDALGIPIGLAFFFRSSATGRVAAFYPGPAGATESLIPLDAWGLLETDNPVLAELESDLEALLVNRMGGASDGYRVSIDECYRLVGIIRLGWHGFSGGDQVWSEIARFFAGLKGAGAGHA